MCCDKTCALVGCQEGFKNKGQKTIALTHDECCETWWKKAQFLLAVALWLLKADHLRPSKAIRISVKPSKEMTCAAFTCSGNWSQLDSASSRPANLRDILREEMQSQHVMRVKPVIVRRVGSDLSTCCQPNCAMFDCKAGCRAVWVLGVYLLFVCRLRRFQFCNCHDKRSRHAVVSWAGC